MRDIESTYIYGRLIRLRGPRLLNKIYKLFEIIYLSMYHSFTIHSKRESQRNLTKFQLLGFTIN